MTPGVIFSCTQVRKSPPGSFLGFTLVEFLLAAVLVLTTAGVIFNFLAPAHRAFQAQPEQSDLQQRLRVSVDTLTRDLVMAGAGTYAGPASGPLTNFIAPIMPYRAFGDAPDSSQAVFFRRDAISFVYVPSTASQTTLASSLAAGALDVQLEWSPNCPASTATQICGLESGDRMIVFDDKSQWDLFTVDQIGNGVMLLRRRGPPGTASYQVGAAAAEVRLGSYYLKSDDANRTYQLMHHDGWATELPVVDDVVRLEFQYFGDPEPPRLTGRPLDEPVGPWTTYGPAPPPVEKTRGSWPQGENCTFLVANGEHLPRLHVLAGGAALVELTAAQLTDGPWCPNTLTLSRFDADVLRIRKIRVTVRVQSALAALRGPAGALFLKGGTASGAAHYVPDLEVQFDVAPRNMNLGQ
jgi:Tfp pilus assembly protein PilW